MEIAEIIRSVAGTGLPRVSNSDDQIRALS